MSDLKRIMISLPDYLLEEVDGIVALEKKNRSEFIREAMKLYIEEKKRKSLREQMRRGYQEMASINLSLAQEGLANEDEVQDLFDKALGV
ncbi:MAG: ribbon-helix-helix protein, CopG family [Clostridia bacterium]|nr:ribbon-helix-helix protein, CopG family [Clostridia bacterium]